MDNCPYYGQLSIVHVHVHYGDPPLTLAQVIASEDWNGMREDFKMASDTITFRVDYAPRVG